MIQTDVLLEFLDGIIPFRFLRKEMKLRLIPRLSECIFEADSRIIRQGDPDDKTVYLLSSGTVEARDVRGPVPVRFNTIEEGHYFGEYEPLFQCPRYLEIHALTEVRCYSMEEKTFLSLLEDRAFAQSLGSILRDKQGIFDEFQRFKAELMRGITRGRIDFDALLPFFTDLEPALHPLSKDPVHIDLSALLYAVRRLPENVTKTFAFLLTDELPPPFTSAGDLFPKIETASRLRFIWEIMPGKSLALMRNGLSDIIDLLTCLCVYAVEALKIRNRFRDTTSLMTIQNFLEKDKLGGTLDEIRVFLAGGLGFTPEETEGLLAVWGQDAVSRIYDILRHREMFSIDVRRQRNIYNSRSSEKWTQAIGDAAEKLLGHDPTALPEGTRVHIISSNTHSVLNCLNPWLIEKRKDIFSWAEKEKHVFMEEPWFNDLDLLYGIARDYFARFPDEARESRNREIGCGILRLEETASTGIQVQLIDGSRLAGREIDPDIKSPRKGSRNVIVNIDYAFGEQAEHVIRSLLMLFGRTIASVNFLGKAGALLGKRGDILAPTAFIKQSSERYVPLPESSPRCKDCLSSRIPDRAIHTGPMLTVEGTLLQNRRMLYFYKHIWGCVGIEMEGVHYYRQVLESRNLGIIPEETALRFYYYVSDLPLDHDSNLSSRLSGLEGIPPLYAITREILSEIFED